MQRQPGAVAEVQERQREVEECALMLAEDLYGREIQHESCTTELDKVERKIQIYEEAAELIRNLGPCVDPTPPAKPEAKKILVESKRDHVVPAGGEGEADGIPPPEPMYEIVPPSSEEMQAYKTALARFQVVIVAWRDLDKVERRVMEIQEQKKKINMEENPEAVQQAEADITAIRTEQEQRRVEQRARRDQLHEREYFLASKKQVLELAAQHMDTVRKIVDKELMFNLAEITSEQTRWPMVGECDSVVGGIEDKMAHEERKQLDTIKEIQRQKQEQLTRLFMARTRLVLIHICKARCASLSHFVYHRPNTAPNPLEKIRMENEAEVVAKEVEEKLVWLREQNDNEVRAVTHLWRERIASGRQNKVRCSISFRPASSSS